MKVDFLQFKLFGKDTENDADMSKTIFFQFLLFFTICWFFKKLNEKLGSNRCPPFTILTEQKLIKGFMY